MCSLKRLGVVVIVWSFCLVPAAMPSDDTENLSKKLEELNSVTGDNVIAAQIKALATDPKEAARLVEYAAALKKKGDVLNYNSAFILARTAQDLKNLDAGKTFYRVCTKKAIKLQSGQKLAQAYSGWVEMLFANKKFDEAEKLCQEILEMDEKSVPQSRILKASATRQMIRAIARQGKFDEAIKMVDNILDKRPEDWITIELKASIQRDAGKLDDAVKSYEEVLELIGKEKDLPQEIRDEYLDSIRYTMSGVLVEMKKIDKAADQLKELLKRKPDDPTYLNDLGFIWADHDKNLGEAEKMIRKAIDMDVKERLKDRPDAKPEDIRANSAYLDSLGWVLYKQKKYKEAKTYLEQAIEDKDAHHIEIFDHLGDAYLALGDKAEAVKAWKRGIEVAGTGKRDQERKLRVEKKLKEYE